MFIVIEGADGTGKSTLVKNLEPLLRKMFPRRRIIPLKNPGTTLLGALIRGIPKGAAIWKGPGHALPSNGSSLANPTPATAAQPS